MIYGSVCSGIEAASVAWHPLGWRPSFFSEIDPFPRAVLTHHYPDVPLHGDFTTIQSGDYAAIDLLVGGTPCQSFSVAGLRGGLDDERGNLALEFLRLADSLAPRWLVWENVPGVLSSNGGRDFGSILGGMVELGYGFAYRVLDAQFFGVAQRRRRVFVVGYLGDWRPAAAVLFERHGLLGHPAPSREARKDAAGRAVAGTLRSRHNFNTTEDGTGALQPVISMAHGQGGAEIGFDRGPTLTCNHEAPIAAYGIRTANTSSNGWGIQEEATHTLDQAMGIAVAHAFDARQSDVIQYGDKTGPLDTDGHSVGVLASSAKDRGADAGEVAPTLRAMPHHGSHANGGGQVAVAFQSSQSGVRVGDTHATLDANNGPRRHNGALVGMQVRRLTPRECERLQGFPDDYTLIPWRGKPADQCPDGPRYKALGNSMAVPVMRWIGERIDRVERIVQAAQLDTSNSTLRHRPETRASAGGRDDAMYSVST